MEDDGFLGRQVDSRAMCAAWDLFFRGASLEGVSRHLRVRRSVKATNRAVLDWVSGYSRLLTDYAESMMAARKVDGGPLWHEDIAVVKLLAALRYVFLLKGRGRKGRPILLALRYARDRDENRAVGLLRDAKDRTNDLPERIVSGAST